jgi:hypothetical protein
MQTMSVRSAKAVASGMSVVGSVVVFTPAAAVGVGLLAAGGGLGVLTAGGDVMGTHWQREEMVREHALLAQARGLAS